MPAEAPFQPPQAASHPRMGRGSRGNSTAGCRLSGVGFGVVVALDKVAARRSDTFAAVRLGLRTAGSESFLGWKWAPVAEKPMLRVPDRSGRIRPDRLGTPKIGFAAHTAPEAPIPVQIRSVSAHSGPTPSSTTYRERPDIQNAPSRHPRRTHFTTTVVGQIGTHCRLASPEIATHSGKRERPTAPEVCG